MLVDSICVTCGKTFQVERHKIKIGKGKYCSKECFQKRPNEAKNYKTICEKCGNLLKEVFVDGKRKACCTKCASERQRKKKVRCAEVYI